MEKINPYQQLLDDNSKTQQAALQKQLEAAQTASASIVDSQKVVNEDYAAAKAYLDQTLEELKVMRQLTQLVLTTDLDGKNAANLATTVSADAAKISTAIAKAARSVEVASQSIAQLYSDAAGMQAKASSEDSGTELAVLSAKAAVDCKEAATASENTTMAALEATIAAAKSNAAIAGDSVKKMSGDIDVLYAALNANTQAIQGLANKAAIDKDTAHTNKKNTELQKTTTGIDEDSAEEASKLKTGPSDDAKNAGKEPKRKTTTATK